MPTTLGSTIVFSLSRRVAFIHPIDKIAFRYNPKYGTLDDVHYMRPRWQQYLESLWLEPHMIKRPASWSLFYNDYQHRKMCISISIALRQSWEQSWWTMLFTHQYFEKMANSKGYKEVSTKINLNQWILKSDLIFCVEQNWNQQLSCLEVHNGNRVKKISDQIKQYVPALSSGAISEKFNHHGNPWILLVFQEEATMRTIIERIGSDAFYMYLMDFYLFKSFDQILVEPISGRINLHGNQVALIDHDY